MYKQLFLLSFLFFGISVAGSSQCESCEENKDDNTLCYQNSSFEGYCLTFKDGEPNAILAKGKKSKSLPVTDKSTIKDLIVISQNKKLKLTALDILFIQEGLKEWSVASRQLGYSYTDTGLGIKILKEGNGELPEDGQTVKVHYSGFLEDGKKFDSSVDRGQPFSFPLGKGRVIKGWDQGVAKLKIGTKALLQIPPDLAYGSRGAGGAIPPNATLYFEIEVLGVE
ncbi:MAG: FKBP-type peptidyl-prolyl cis-trans isomerase [Bacteroidota bacterium]